MINAQDFQNLDPQNFGNWPIPVKGVLIIIACVAALGAGYWFDTQHQLIELDTEKGKEEVLKKDFREKQWKASTFTKLQEQLKEIESTIKEQRNRLPSEAEVAELITEISQQMIASGLEQELFRPNYDNKDKKKDNGVGENDVYEKLPIAMRVKGDYHSFGKFVSGVSAMPRIVTQHDVFIHTNPAANDNKLIMEMTVQIYRYLEEKEKAPVEEKEGDKKKPVPTPAPAK